MFSFFSMIHNILPASGPTITQIESRDLQALTIMIRNVNPFTSLYKPLKGRLDVGSKWTGNENSTQPTATVDT